MADVFNLPANPAAQLAALRHGACYTMLNVQDIKKDLSLIHI